MVLIRSFKTIQVAENSSEVPSHFKTEERSKKDENCKICTGATSSSPHDATQQLHKGVQIPQKFWVDEVEEDTDIDITIDHDLDNNKYLSKNVVIASTSKHIARRRKEKGP